MEAKPVVSGTKEWAAHSVNCCLGCSHACLYCYARQRAVRFKRIPTPLSWSVESIRESAVAKRHRKFPGRVMFPTTHDITPGNVDACVTVLRSLLKADNEVLIVSKPHVDVIDRLTQEFAWARRQIMFRFTIGSTSDETLGFWEPGAPTYAERTAALRLAHDIGFETSVSAEPLLGPESVGQLVSGLEPFVTDSIWIGKLNKIRERTAWTLPPDHPQIVRLTRWQSDAHVRRIHGLLKDHPLIRWKESYKKPLGLALADRPGLDR